MPGTPVWQRNYHDHVIRDEKDLYSKRKYIRENPLKWELDEENPVNLQIKIKSEGSSFSIWQISILLIQKIMLLLLQEIGLLIQMKKYTSGFQLKQGLLHNILN